jgi:hypothetical protein
VNVALPANVAKPVTVTDESLDVMAHHAIRYHRKWYRVSPPEWKISIADPSGLV